MALNLRARQNAPIHRTAGVHPTAAARTDFDVIAAAADKWHVPRAVLWGVYGVETTFGSDLSTSSAGAQGPFQFIPGTAHDYHVNVHSLPSSAEGAAHYLHDLFGRTHSWDAALHSYSGGGYGLRTVEAKAKTKPPHSATAGGTAAAALAGGSSGSSPGSAASTSILGWADALGQILTASLDPKFWLRIGLILGGLVLMFLGLQKLTGIDVTGVATRGAIKTR